MRLLLYALLIVNLAFFAWARWVDVATPAPSAVSDSIPQLELAGAPAHADAGSAPSPASAVPGAQAPASAPPAAAAAAAAPVSTPSPVPAVAAPAATGVASVPAVAAPATPGATAPAGARCRTIGPFDDANVANVVSDRLRSRGFVPRARSVVGNNPNVYWVYIGELTAEAQRQVIKTLNTAGIHDALSMTQPEESDRVSVGVFSDQAHAVKRAEQVRALGFKPTLGMRQRNLTLHWVDFDMGAAAAEPSAAQLVGVGPKPAPGVGPPKIVDCPSADPG